jgi:hypothetical protein
MKISMLEWSVLMDALNGSMALVDRKGIPLFQYNREIRIKVWEHLQDKMQGADAQFNLEKIDDV